MTYEQLKNIWCLHSVNTWQQLTCTKIQQYWLQELGITSTAFSAGSISKTASGSGRRRHCYHLSWYVDVGHGYKYKKKKRKPAKEKPRKQTKKTKKELWTQDPALPMGLFFWCLLLFFVFLFFVFLFLCLFVFYCFSCFSFFPWDCSRLVEANKDAGNKWICLKGFFRTSDATYCKFAKPGGPPVLKNKKHKSNTRSHAIDWVPSWLISKSSPFLLGSFLWFGLFLAAQNRCTFKRGKRPTAPVPPRRQPTFDLYPGKGRAKLRKVWRTVLLQTSWILPVSGMT